MTDKGWMNSKRKDLKWQIGWKKPETGNEKPETRNQKPETRN
jgi:hypothetical protein